MAVRSKLLESSRNSMAEIQKFIRDNTTTASETRTIFNILEALIDGLSLEKDEEGDRQRDQHPIWQFLNSQDETISCLVEASVSFRKGLGSQLERFRFAKRHGNERAMYVGDMEESILYRNIQTHEIYKCDPVGVQEVSASLDPQAGGTQSLARFIAAASEPPSGHKKEDSLEVYTALRDDSWFRLLLIEPGALESPLACRLVPVARSQAVHRYETLSYSWDTTISWRDPKSIECNGTEVLVQENLFQALVHLRLRDEPRVVWVDALCIDQKNTEERTQQVRIMGQIYNQAFRTTVWLGTRPGGYGADPDPKASAAALDMVCQVVNSWDGRQPATYRVVDASSGSIRSVRPTDQPDFESDEFKTAMRALFNCTWFDRRWIIQEVVLSRDVEMAWSHFRIPWRWVGLAAALLRNQQDSIIRDSRCYGVYHAYLIFRLGNHGSLPPVDLSFLHLLRLTSGFKTSEPRDRVFALLGITTRDSKPGEQQAFIQPNYGSTEQEILTIVVEKLLAQRRPLSFLSDAEPRWSTQRNGLVTIGKLPSWLPMWTERRAAMLSPWTLDDPFNPAKGLPFRRYPNADASCLEVLGVELSTIIWCSGAFSRTHTFAQTVGAALCSGAFGPPADGLAPGTLSAFARTLCGGRDAYGSRRADADADAAAAATAHFVAFVGGHLPAAALGGGGGGGVIGGSPEAFIEAAKTTCTNRRLFVTAGGHLGLGPLMAKPGDSVCLLGGADMAFVMRRIRRRREGDGERDGDGDGYRLVGECYVDGVMEGEAVDAMRTDAGDQTHWGPFDPRLVVERLYKFKSLEGFRPELDAIVERIFSLASERYQTLRETRIRIY